MHDFAIGCKVWEFLEECVVDVQDSGPRIRPQDQVQVVKPFVRMSKKRANGTGLAIVARIMRLHQESLYIIDDPRGGASLQLVWNQQPQSPNLLG